MHVDRQCRERLRHRLYGIEQDRRNELFKRVIIGVLINIMEMQNK